MPDPALSENSATLEVTHRERLGGYLHPRDMRRLTTPFSASNEPDIIVRRHVILLNFDPLRAIIVRDRLLVLVPEGADSLLIQLEQRVRGGIAGMENSIFGTPSESSEPGNKKAEDLSRKPVGGSHEGGQPVNLFTKIAKSVKEEVDVLKGSIKGHPASKGTGTVKKSVSLPLEKDEARNLRMFDNADEWSDMGDREWINLPFELQCTDACLHIASSLLTEECGELQEATISYIQDLLTSKGGITEDPLIVIRHIKDAIADMRVRVASFIQAMNRILDNDEVS